MKGYFSQLARHTGLRFPNAARPQAPALGSQHPSPLHVEEVTFVPPTATVNTISATVEPTSATPTPEKEEITRAQTSQTTPTIGTEATLSFPEESSTEVRVSSPANATKVGSESLADDNNFRPLSTEHQSPFPERNIERDLISTRPADNNLQPERMVPLAVPQQDHQTNIELPAQAVIDLNPSDPVQREVLVRQYLREVRAWVAAPPTQIADVPENEIVAERQATTAWKPESVAIVERESPTAKQPTQRDHIDVHETSLSIGSISVVIEDPKPNVTTIAPTPSAPSAPRPQPQPEPTSLSRYYLQRW